MDKEKSTVKNKGTLYVVATPIGNLGDMSPRAVDTLRSVNVIAAEDTRHSRKLCSHFEFSTPLISYHEHNQKQRDPYLLERLASGESVALISDAGVPGVSDPGESLVQKAIKNGILVVPVPGPSAVLCALVASGISMQPFTFIGFLPRLTSSRKKVLKSWALLPSTLVFYESPHRVLKMLQDCLVVLGDRQAAVGRELTKKNEEWIRSPLSETIQLIESRGVRGEYTIVIEGKTDHVEVVEDNKWNALPIINHVENYIKDGKSKKEAIRLASQDRGIPKKEVYNAYHRGP